MATQSVSLVGKTREEALALLASGATTVEAVTAHLKALDDAKTVRDVHVKGNPVTGGVSLYGINKQFPITMYPSQWKAVLGSQCDGVGGKVLAFIAEHADYLPTGKNAKAAKPVPANMIGEGKPFRIPKAVAA